MSDESEEVEALNAELDDLYERRAEAQKRANGYRQRAKNLDEFAVELTHRARAVKAERDNVATRIRITELERELKTLRAQLDEEEKGEESDGGEG